MAPPNFRLHKSASWQKPRSRKPHTPTCHLLYEALAEGSSTAPHSKFCDVLGYPCSNTHLSHFLHFYDHLVYKHIRNAPQNLREELRALRNLKHGF